MPARTEDFDLAGLRLSSGEGKRLEFTVPIPQLKLGGETYSPPAEGVPVHLEVSRMIGHGYALALRFSCTLAGPCMRCLNEAAPVLDVDAREVDRPGGGEELQSPYLKDEQLDLASWASDALVLSLPAQVLCREDCAGLCPVCAADLNQAAADHHHDSAPDPRWSKLRELKLE